MKILLLGKAGSIIHLIEDVAGDLRMAGHIVTIVPTRNPLMNKSVERVLLSPAIGAPLAMRIARKIRRPGADLIVMLGDLDTFPKIVLETIANTPGRPPLIAWIGDRFTDQAASVANLFDIVAYTDTGLRELHRRFGFRSTDAFVPLGATRAVRRLDVSPGRASELAFVAAPTQNRRELLAGITQPIAIFGPGWQGAKELVHHSRDTRRIHEQELARIYARHMGVLNVRHSRNVLNGLNQRHFAPYIQGTAAVTDPQSDLRFCFDEGKEILVYQDTDELNELYAALRRDPARAVAIGLAGQRRVLACHTYAHRFDTLAGLAGVKTTGTRRHEVAAGQGLLQASFANISRRRA
jgi:spore maturation protein CgeB